MQLANFGLPTVLCPAAIRPSLKPSHETTKLNLVVKLSYERGVSYVR